MFKVHLKAFLEDTNGATAIEYGLLVALLSLGIIGALTAAGEATSETFDNIASQDFIP